MTSRRAISLTSASLVSLCVGATCFGEEVSVGELLDRIRTDIYAEGASFSITAKEYQSTTVEEWDPGIYSQTTFETDGQRRRIVTESSPIDFGREPEFAATETEVYDGETYRKLRLGDEPRTFSSGIIKHEDSTLAGAERILVGLLYVSVANEDLLDRVVLRDTESGFYGLCTIAENGGQVVLWGDPARGYRIAQKDLLRDGECFLRWRVQLEERDGLWVPKRIDQYDVYQGVETIVRSTEIVSIDRKPEIDSGAFQLEFPKDVRVTDLR